ncbi:MAG: phosphopentomutase [Acidobacteria bacterium]|nr:phosphopentomutase [Acidobacteriota bacterium]
MAAPGPARSRTPCPGNGGPFRRVALIVLDSVGIGEMPDAAAYGDAGSDTLGHVAASRPLRLPTLVRLGLANIKPLAHLEPPARPAGAYGKAAIASNGKDTTTGHWEMAGLYLEHAFPTYPNGFPGELIERFEAAIGRRVLGNKPASGTEIIQELGAEHLRSGSPIVYTSADSVFQVAAHEEVIPVEELYRICRIARELLVPPHQVGRVIARPFVGQPGNFTRTERRKDLAIEPPVPTLLDRLSEGGVFTCGIGMIVDHYCGRGLAAHTKTRSNADGIAKTLAALEEHSTGLLFTNLVDFDMLYGHRNNVEGYARALEEADEGLGRMVAKLGPDDLLVVTADHGCDPATPSTDHSREYVPVLAYSPTGAAGVNLGTRGSLADTGQTIAENFGLNLPFGSSFLADLTSRR